MKGTVPATTIAAELRVSMTVDDNWERVDLWEVMRGWGANK